MKILLFILIPLIFISCKKKNDNNCRIYENAIIGNYNITIIDNCEYIVIQYDRSKSITHKGNCKNHKK